MNRSIGRPNEVQVPWWFSPVAVGPKDRDGRRLLAVGGNSGWCTSNTRGGTLRVDEILDTSMRTLLDRDVSYWSGNDAYITAAVLGSTAEFRYDVMLYPDLMARQAIARFSRAGSGLQREAPIALSLAGFIDEWLKMDDSEGARWSTSRAAQHHPQLARWVAQGFTFKRIARCAGNPESWQVQVQFVKPVQERIITLTGASAAAMRIADVSMTPRAVCKEAAMQELEKNLN